MSCRGLSILLPAALFAASLQAQQTIQIPRAQFDALPVNPLEDVEMDLSTLEGMLRAMEDLARTDWMGSLPESIVEQILGMSPIEAHAAVVWEMQVTGNWTETVSGSGTLSVLDQTALGAANGRQFFAVLDTDARAYPFHLFSFVPDSAPAVAWTRFSGSGDGQRGGGTGFSPLANHMFDFDRVLGYATPEGMRIPRFTDLEEDYLYTEVQSGRIRVDSGGNAYRMSFSATVQEFHSDGSRPTGRMATVRGWVCEAAAYAADPENCLYDDFQIVDHTPSDQRGNVNPMDPALSVTFSDPVDLDSLAQHFTLYTGAADGTRMEVDGSWRRSAHVGAWRDQAVERAAQGESLAGAANCSPGNVAGIERLRAIPEVPLESYADPQEYVFEPATPLRPGTIYEARIAGGEDGVQALHGDVHLADDHRWRFSTLLHLAEQQPAGESPGEPTDALRLDYYQTVRSPSLVTDKPAMTRLHVDWSQHGDIAQDWQPERFEFEVELSPRHARVVAQHGLPARLNRLVWFDRQAAFDREDRRLARNTLNFFGWLPDASGPDRLEVVACPHDPFPYPLADAETRQEREIGIWDHDPGQLDFYYVVAEVGPWASALEKRIAELARQRGELPANLIEALYLLARGEHLPQDFLDTLADTPEQIARLLSDVEGGPPEEDRRLMLQTLRLAEEYTTQFLPYRSARAHPTNVTFGSYGLFLATLRDPLTGLAGLSGEPAAAIGWLDGSPLTVIRLGAYIRWLQRIARDHIGPDDIVVVLTPAGVLDGAEGLGISDLKDVWLFKGFLDYLSRAVVMQINDDFDTDTLATGLVHEFGHVLSLVHNPGDADPEKKLIMSGRFDPEIEGFRLRPDGLDGWNKTGKDRGNAETTEALVSLMWPYLLPSALVMPTRFEYAAMQVDIERGFGRQATRIPATGLRLAASQYPVATDAQDELLATADPQDATADHLVLTGVIDPAGRRVLLDPLRTRTLAPRTGAGRFQAELVDPEGTVLRSAAFEVEDPRTHPLIGNRTRSDPAEASLFWPEFRVTLQPHRRAAALVIRDSEGVLARLEPRGGPPELRLETAGPVPIDPGTEPVRWAVDAQAPVFFDVEYSPTGQAPWQPLSLHQPEPWIAVAPEDLKPGPDPTLRITAQSGLHATRRQIPVELTRAPEPHRVELPPPGLALHGGPVTLWFDTELDPQLLEAHVELLDPQGRRVETVFHHLPRQSGLSVLPSEPLKPGTRYAVTLRAGLEDRYGNTLKDDRTWNFITAGEPGR